MKTRHLIPALFATSVPVFANGGGYLEGVKSTGPFRPVNVDNVEMQSEKLDIELKQDAALVSITYQLHNPGKAVTVEMGFPCSVVVKPKTDKEGNQLPVTSLPQLEGFALKADGESVESKLVKDHAKLPAGPAGPKPEEVDYEERVLTGWQVVKVPFTAGQTRMVTVKYRNPYYREANSISDNEDISAPSMRYLFSAAALWAGPIKTGEVTVRATGVDPEVVTLSHPKRFKREGSQWTWNFTDFEPTMQDDLEIVAGEHEFTQFRQEEGKPIGTYVMRGRSPDHKELQKSGKWFFIGKQYTAAASSSLKASGGNTYGPENLNDEDDWGNAWVEGAEGDGIGESLTLTMKNPQKVTRLLVTNGYRKDEEIFKKNNRVKKLAVSVNGGAPFTAELQDGFDKEPASIVLPPDAGPVNTVKLTIQEVYRGTAYHDTCITSIGVETQLTKAPPIFPCR